MSRVGKIYIYTAYILYTWCTYWKQIFLQLCLLLLHCTCTYLATVQDTHFCSCTCTITLCMYILSYCTRYPFLQLYLLLLHCTYVATVQDTNSSWKLNSTTTYKIRFLEDTGVFNYPTTFSIKILLKLSARLIQTFGHVRRRNQFHVHTGNLKNYDELKAHTTSLRVQQSLSLHSA